MPLLTSQPLPAQAAAAADVTTIIGLDEVVDDSGVGVSRVVVTPPPGFTTVTGQATNNAQITLRQVRGGTVLQPAVAQLVLNAGTNLAAETPVQVPVINPVTVTQDDVLDVVLHQNGTGLAVGAGLVVSVDVS